MGSRGKGRFHGGGLGDLGGSGGGGGGADCLPVLVLFLFSDILTPNLRGDQQPEIVNKFGKFS